MTDAYSIDTSVSKQTKKRGNRKLTQAEFLDKVQKQHPDLDFSQAIYVNAVTKVKAVCREHGLFERTPNSLDSGGCPTCGKARCGQYRKKSFATFVAEANAIHNSKFEYDVLYEIEESASYVFDLEKRLHSMLKGSRYSPLTKFNGYTECFTTIKPIEKLLKELSNTEQLQLLA